MTRVTLDTTALPVCCLAHLGPCDGAVIRHHAGNDGLLKLFHRQIRAEYPLFLDCYPLCDGHHMQVHFMYEVLKHQVCGTHFLNTLTQKALLEVRVRYIELFMAIKSGSVKLKKVSKDFRLKWKRGHKEWMKNQAQSSSHTSAKSETGLEPT